jgi:sporulation protein YlmC with PRC-barrel domain
MTSSTVSHDVISSDKVEGTKVYNTAGDKLGSVDDLMIDKVSGQIRYAVLEFGGFLGMGTDRYPLPWNMLKYDLDKEGYVVPIDKDKLKARRATQRRRYPITTTSTASAFTTTTASTGKTAPREDLGWVRKADPPASRGPVWFPGIRDRLDGFGHQLLPARDPRSPTCCHSWV